MFLMTATCLAAVPFAAGQGNEFDLADEDLKAEGPERKVVRFWRRPSADTPAAQLALAREREAAGEIASAGRAYDALVRAWPDAPEAVVAQRAYADSLEQRGSYEHAFEECQYLVDFYAGRFDYQDVVKTQFRLARAVMDKRRARWFFGGYTSPSRALPLLEQLAENAPNWKRAAEVLFLVGSLHEQEDEYEEAIRRYEQVRQRWPKGDFAAAASFARARCLAAVGRKNLRDEESISLALTALSSFLRDYPDDPNAPAAERKRSILSERLAGMQYERAVFYDHTAHRPKSALIAYAEFLRRFPMSDRAPEVTRRMEELEAIVEPEKDSSSSDENG